MVFVTNQLLQNVGFYLYMSHMDLPCEVACYVEKDLERVSDSVCWLQWVCKGEVSWGVCITLKSSTNLNNLVLLVELSIIFCKAHPMIWQGHLQLEQLNIYIRTSMKLDFTHSKARHEAREMDIAGGHVSLRSSTVWMFLWLYIPWSTFNK